MAQHSRPSRWPERLLAYSLAVSPPIAVLLGLVQVIRHRSRLNVLQTDRITLVVFSLLLAWGVISALIAPHRLAALQGPSAMLLLFMFWLVGRTAIGQPVAFSVDMQRGIALVALVTLGWIVSPFTLAVKLGSLTLSVASPHDPVAVFGLGANGLGVLLAFGTVLALGRLFQSRSIADRLEGGFIAAATLSAALLIGVRGAMVGAVVGALVLSLTAGLKAVVPIPLIAGFVVLQKPGIWSSFLLITAETEKPRIVTWLSALAMIRRHPLFGVGPFHFNALKPVYLPALAGGVDIGQLGPHNIYLHMASEWGIPAAVFLFVWMLSWPYRLWSRRQEAWRWSLVAGLCAYLVMGLFDDPLFTLHISGPVFVGLGLAASDATGGDG